MVDSDAEPFPISTSGEVKTMLQRLEKEKAQFVEVVSPEKQFPYSPSHE
jgi:hypothetical protein